MHVAHIPTGPRARISRSSLSSEEPPTLRVYQSTLQVPIRAGKIPGAFHRSAVRRATEHDNCKPHPRVPHAPEAEPSAPKCAHPGAIQARRWPAARRKQTAAFRSDDFLPWPGKRLPRDARGGARTSACPRPSECGWSRVQSMLATADGNPPLRRTHCLLPPTHVTGRHAPSVSRSGSCCRRCPTLCSPSTLCRERRDVPGRAGFCFRLTKPQSR